MKWPDLVLIVVLVLLSFLPSAYFALQNMGDGNKADQKFVVIKVDNVEKERIALEPGKAAYQYRLKLPNGDENIITIDGEKVSMIEANCPDQICVHFPVISHDGDQIVCLPHKVIVEIQGGSSGEGDLNTY